MDWVNRLSRRNWGYTKRPEQDYELPYKSNYEMNGFEEQSLRSNAETAYWLTITKRDTPWILVMSKFLQGGEWDGEK